MGMSGKEKLKFDNAASPKLLEVHTRLCSIETLCASLNDSQLSCLIDSFLIDSFQQSGHAQEVRSTRAAVGGRIALAVVMMEVFCTLG